jgi:hypothetical protein
MFKFLDAYYWSTKSDDVAILLGGMRILPEGVPADSAHIKEWRDAIEFALANPDVASA